MNRTNQHLTGKARNSTIPAMTKGIQINNPPPHKRSFLNYQSNAIKSNSLILIMGPNIPHFILFGLDCAFETAQEEGVDNFAVERARLNA